jgi:hypothetical protein
VKHSKRRALHRRYGRSSGSRDLGAQIAYNSSGSEKALLHALAEAGAQVIRAYPAPAYGLASDARRDLLQVHVRFLDGTLGFFAPGGPPRIWTYTFRSGSRPGDAELPGVPPSQIASVTRSSWEDR